MKTNTLLKMIKKLQPIINEFNIYGQLTQVIPIEIGHINQTYKISTINGLKREAFILQRINTQIFKQPAEVMENITNVANFLLHKRYPKTVLVPVQSANRQFFVYVDGNYWRLYPFIENTYTFNEVSNASQAYAAAFAFGEYANYLSDFDATTLNVTIPNFHNTNLRYQQFLEAIKEGKSDRKKRAKQSIEKLKQYQYLLTSIREVKLPLRVTHNDTKINNILFDKTNGEAVCVIDLDTLMPDTLLYDYGDMVRTFTPPLDENSADFEQIYVRKEILHALTEGYKDGLKGKMTDLEEKLLLYGGKLTIFEQALRFLTDYLLGDVYYKVANKELNLIRTKNQLCLLESLINLDG